MARCPAREEHGMRDATVIGFGSARRAARIRPGAQAAQEGTFGVDDLSALRRLALEHARRAGLGTGRLGDFVLAVNEAATSAICRGGGRVRLRLWDSGDEVGCEVRGGTRMPSGQPPAVPDDTDSLRLWVVSQVSSDVDLSYGPDETIVRLSIRTR
jgi:serine/threonine-protein kinase RsbW